ncbi:MAG: right-handed parallel beta-helix repeat-containing protein [Phycisphaerae bacterium]|nr:right-handed parallel beta-helix repeat-containing protein [Phycisphaerae bacterium]
MTGLITNWKTSLFAAVLLALCLSVSTSYGLTINVVDRQNNPVSGFRWLVEEDTSHATVPGAEVADSLAVSIHKSYAPVVMSGSSNGSSADVNIPADKRYVLSVLPYTGYSISGQNIAAGQTSVKVVVNEEPIPTAQISVFVFEDTASINNAPDAGEPGLANFRVVISDIFGQQMLDAFGNMLGTTYVQDANGNFVYNPDGSPMVDIPGDAIIKTDVNGEASIKFLPPGKYGVVVIPPEGEQGWIQTSTIEGTPTVDAWVKANEPPVFVELGPASYHVFYGFLKQFDILDTLPNPGEITGQITGKLVFNHFDRPPYLQGFWPGEPVESAWVGLNSLTGQGLYAAPCNMDSTFTISDVPPGIYELVTWDENLDAIFGFNQVIVPPAGGTVSLGNILSFRWFGTLEGSVFLDMDEDGFRDANEMGISNQNINIRFRDGTVYQAAPTDHMGDYSFSEVFPFFKWLVVEVDFARYKATGITTVVDYGGQIPDANGWDMPSFGKLNPQPQFDPNGNPIININTDNNLSFTETGEVLTRAMHLFLGQLNIFDWGKTSYGPDENGGISGIVYYAVTRAENDPRYGVGEPWEPGIPRVQVNLYLDDDCNGVIDDLDGDDGPTLADVDNYPFGWMDDPNLKGIEDIDRNDNGIFNYGDAIQITTTDSWDDSAPTWAIHENLPVIHGQQVKPGFDNFGTWNQAQPGVFDGGYAFGSYYPGGMVSESNEVEGLPGNVYIVEAAAPYGYELVKEEDKNVDFGDEYEPSPLLLPPVCVGDPHLVPQYLSMQTDANGVPLPGIDPNDLIETYYYGQTRPLADRKQVIVAQAKNTAADFFFFTKVPKAARAVGFINNDFAAEFDPCSPIFGEKSAPSWLPISFQDWAGNEVARVYCDEFGAYNAMLPSTFTANIGAPSGMSPQMLTFVINHPGPIPDPCDPNKMIIDPYYDSDYSQSAFTFNFMPATTTYLDTPVVPVAAFVGYPNRNLDIEPADGTPVIYSVEGPDGGPVICSDGGTVTIKSVGNKMVPNPDYKPNDPNFPELIERDFGFGNTQGTASVGGASLNITSWSNSTIEATVNFASVNTGTVQVTRGDNGKKTDLGVTLHVNACGNVVHVSGGSIYPDTPIQDAIDAAGNGALIIIEPGTYWENPIVYKPVILQGSGAESTILNAMPVPSEKVSSWFAKLNQLFADGFIPAGAANFDATQLAGILVYANPAAFSDGNSVIIDGLQVTGASSGGGLYAANNADYLEIRNNKIKSNLGTLGGGITIGNEEIGTASNQNVKIYDNHIVKNGGMTGGGGITLYDSSTNYQVTNNFIMGNFTGWSGAGVAHVGLSNNGLIARNQIVFNEVFYGGQIGGDGGGIIVTSVNPAVSSDGTGSVVINANLIQGNLAGSGFGGGISAIRINGQDAQEPPVQWYQLGIYNNIIVNNVAANAAGGIYLSDAANVKIINNTISNNDSAGTAANTFTAGNLAQSNPQPAGIVSILHSTALAAATGQDYSDPMLIDNIITGNRSFYWDSSLNGGKGGIIANPNDAVWDLAVVNRLSSSQRLHPDYCLLTSLTDSLGSNYDANNITGNPQFVDSYNNTLVVSAVLDEGGNFITTRFDEIDRQGDYHITLASDALNLGAGQYVEQISYLICDFDSQRRPYGNVNVDAGADEAVVSPYSADFDIDLDVDYADLQLLASFWLDTLTEQCDCVRPPVDLNCDGIVNCLDFSIFAQQYGQSN